MYLGDTCIFFNLELLRILTTHVASSHPAFIHIWIFEEASSIFWEHAVNERKIEVHTPLRIMILKIGIFGGFFFWGGGWRFWISLPSPLSKKDATCLLISFFLHTNLLLKIFFCILGEEICHHNFCKSNDWRQYLT